MTTTTTKIGIHDIYCCQDDTYRVFTISLSSTDVDILRKHQEFCNNEASKVYSADNNRGYVFEEPTISHIMSQIDTINTIKVEQDQYQLADFQFDNIIC